MMLRIGAGVDVVNVHIIESGIKDKMRIEGS